MLNCGGGSYKAFGVEVGQWHGSRINPTIIFTGLTTTPPTYSVCDRAVTCMTN